MNNIYVEGELPDCCVRCSLCDADYKGKLYCRQLDETFKENIEITNYKERKENCPLKLLSTRLAEERMNLVKEIRQNLANKLTYNINDLENIMVICNKINSVLDKFERGE